MFNRLMEITKSFGNQEIDPEKSEQLKRTKAEIEKKVTTMLRLIKNEGQGKRKKTKKDTELLGLVENFYKDYQSLYELYDKLISESGTRVVRGRKHKECSSSSSSDSEYYSSEEIDPNNGKKFAFEAVSLEVLEMKNKLASLSEENDTLRSDSEASLSKLRQGEIMNKDLRFELDEKGRELLEKVKSHEDLRLELDNREGENSLLMKKLKENEDSFESKIAELKMQAGNMRVEIDCLSAQKGELEEMLACERANGVAQVKDLVKHINVMKHEVESIRGEVLDKMAQIESLNGELLARKILVEKKMLEDQKGQDDQVNESEQLRLEKEKQLDSLKSKKEELELQQEDKEHSQSNKSMKGLALSKEIRQNPQIVAKKMEDLAEKFRDGFENKFRLLSQRILITEQLNNENKERYMKMKEKYEKETKALEEKVAAYETEQRNNSNNMKEKELISALAESAMNNLESIVSKFEEKNDDFLVHISKVSNDVKFASDEVKRLKHNVDSLVAKLDDKEEEEVFLRDKVWNLEAKVSKEGGEKLNLMQEIDQLEKKVGKYEKQIREKEERLLCLGDEKREAIRQLCMLVDYHRIRFDHLKQLLSMSSLKCTKITSDGARNSFKAVNCV
ncbi:COP1-interactive protein 1-like [Humulus lupulus]|uniref:COP1-interactive protein 1-like n=1 Tax=Humulus lupulus TaxID=3486 RepID=UPI002B4078C4|nr:COP1-interactive protein 1-like [Humulus lupulus]